MNEFEKDTQINPEALDVEWIRQPALVAKYAQASAYAKDAVSRAKDNLEVVKAQMDGEIRKDPAKFGVDKVTEAVVSATILKTGEYQLANDEYLKSKLSADLVQAATIALDHKKAALENLVRLMGQQYFAGPREPRDIGQEWRNQLTSAESGMEEGVDDRVKSRLSRRQEVPQEEPIEPRPARRRRE